MALEKRLRQIEQKLERSYSSNPKTIFVVYGKAKPTELQKQAALTEYQTKHPEWSENDINIIYVPGDETD